MPLTIRTRMLLATNLLVAGIGLVVGWLAIGVAGREIEHKLIDESVVQAAGIIQQMNLPRTSDALLKKVGQILGAEAASGPADGCGIVAASLSETAQRSLAAQLAAGKVPGRVTLDGAAYHVGVAEIPAPPGAETSEPMRLYLLVPQARVASARWQVGRTIAALTLAAVAVATVLAFWLAQTITRPVRNLAARMDRLSTAAAEVDLHALLASERTARGEAAGPGARHNPREITRLVDAYDRLLGQLDETRAQLTESARMATLGQFSATVAHELRNPLSGIKMNARVLSDDLAQAGIDDRSLQMIVREIDRMEAHVEELLRVAGKAPAAPGALPAEESSPVDLGAVADSVVQLFEGRCRQQEIAVERSIDPGAATVRGDERRLRQVLLNLVLNAIEAMPDGGTLRLSATTATEGRIRFRVSDTGAGVAVPAGADVFEPFVTTKPGGTGLGLGISRSIVGQLGGDIGYTSSPEGTTFWIELPGAHV